MKNETRNHGGPVFINEWRGPATKKAAKHAFMHVSRAFTDMIAESVNFILHHEGELEEGESLFISQGNVSIATNEVKAATLEVVYDYVKDGKLRESCPMFVIDLLNKEIRVLKFQGGDFAWHLPRNGTRANSLGAAQMVFEMLLGVKSRVTFQDLLRIKQEYKEERAKEG